jgi:hypothetical protein
MTDAFGEEWVHGDAIRVMGIGLFRQVNGESAGELPWNGTEGDIRFGEADDLLDRTPGLRYVIEAGIRALHDDSRFTDWLVTLYSGERDRCRPLEAVLAGALAKPPDPVPGAMTPDQVADALIADLHERYGVQPALWDSQP